MSHQFTRVHFNKPTWCEFCGGFLWGVWSKQGFQCSDCKFVCHEKCATSVRSKCNGPLFAVRNQITTPSAPPSRTPTAARSTSPSPPPPASTSTPMRSLSPTPTGASVVTPSVAPVGTLATQNFPPPPNTHAPSPSFDNASSHTAPIPVSRAQFLSSSLSFLTASHPRCGQDSSAKILPNDMLRYIIDYTMYFTIDYAIFQMAHNNDLLESVQLLRSSLQCLPKHIPTLLTLSTCLAQSPSAMTEFQPTFKFPQQSLLDDARSASNTTKQFTERFFLLRCCPMAKQTGDFSEHHHSHFCCACSAENPVVLYLWGLFYLEVHHNLQQAVVLWTKAANLGYVTAQNCIALCYITGNTGGVTGGEQDLHTGAELLREAAGRGNPEALRLYAMCAANGSGVARGREEALAMYRRAVGLGDVVAMHLLAAELLRAAAEPDAQTQAAAESTQRRQALQSEAIALLQSAAGLGLPDAQALLGNCYLKGEGVPVDKTHGLRLIQLASAQGFTQQSS
ncbi:hypothetical protein Pelo_2594 [Pelomyxa schiedti]|nr:hypothetical protein Pelo_2594 [Pelomyxa schiedti]